VKVRFYLGDPDRGGTPIVGTQGENELVVPGIIEARGSKEVQMRWVASELGRLYAVIDEANAISEIHDELSNPEGNNNKGWIEISSAGTPIPEERDNHIPTHITLQQNYPNPFNPNTVIEFGLPSMSEVRLEVFDIMGKKVATLYHGKLRAGKYSVGFNAANFASGVYIYRMIAGNQILTHKMMLIK